ncbi:HupE/UreJ family protein [Paracoccus tegillarcae]|uniref:Urease accessory protein n=1 Tax=Paracoccus tegillarcae TaxID=1529068 RepID=A0A2K9F5M5_9RHOB|nr:HupE/UreJ family protein [Paracoccus tegillarcae]AUH34481.1 urease accessory protein [Paracoccus tegillarcae]
MKRILAIATAVALPTAALAHPGHDAGSFPGGFAHPFSGADHMLAMIALGLLAAQIGGRAIWALPLSFVTAMLLGGVSGFAGMPFPAVEPVILASVIVIGAAAALALRPPLTALIGMAAIFGAAHGWAHGAEGPAAGMAVYAMGFAVATALLHGAGLAAGRGLPALLLRGTGLIAALSGVAIAVAG